MQNAIDLPPIFDSRGAFIEISDEALNALSDTRRAVYQKVRQCAVDLKVADSAVATAIENIKKGFDAVVEMEKYIGKTFPQMTHFDLWKQTFKGA